MAGIHSDHDNEPISVYLDSLRVLARRFIVDGLPLDRGDTFRKEIAMRRFSELGGACRMSEREMVSLMLRGVFNEEPSCWCSKCRAAYMDELESAD
ncbi:MAG: hypothetical protein J4N64_03730 [Chloroflexi bacterium]|nr:hypothetical protein [Chloroflexota bacterium]MCI0812804.1 hypothetical protein [Chloroflexota bacterium]MCI0840859.1 hypothetical protein [Chloroflexota bacterium]